MSAQGTLEIRESNSLLSEVQKSNKLLNFAWHTFYKKLMGPYNPSNDLCANDLCTVTILMISDLLSEMTSVPVTYDHNDICASDIWP